MHIKKYVEIMQGEGLNQGQVAKQLGISGPVLSNIINDKKKELTIGIAVRIKKASGGLVSDVEDFFTLEV